MTPSEGDKTAKEPQYFLPCSLTAKIARTTVSEKSGILNPLCNIRTIQFYHCHFYLKHNSWNQYLYLKSLQADRRSVCICIFKQYAKLPKVNLVYSNFSLARVQTLWIILILKIIISKKIWPGHYLSNTPIHLIKQKYVIMMEFQVYFIIMQNFLYFLNMPFCCKCYMTFNL